MGRERAGGLLGRCEGAGGARASGALRRCAGAHGLALLLQLPLAAVLAPLACAGGAESSGDATATATTTGSATIWSTTTGTGDGSDDVALLDDVGQLLWEHVPPEGPEVEDFPYAWAAAIDLLPGGDAVVGGADGHFFPKYLPFCF
ncbi:MAG: hypothetical protein KC486_03495 [Myxococcales bacterium]|nr:hypothetical protein [Myxococcales bacterium]